MSQPLPALDLDERRPPPRNNIDWFIFMSTAAGIFAVCIPLGLFPERGAQMMDAAFTFVTHKLGVLYILFSAGAVCLLLFLAFSRYGRIRMGGHTPDFGDFSWAAMLFCGGIGTSVLYWGTIEWAHYYQAPPFQVEAHSGAALRWATSYPVFHWGFTGWALYCLPAIAMAYAYHVKRVGALRLSSACGGLLGDAVNGFGGRVIDLTYMLGLIGATSTGIGLAVPLIAACLRSMFGLDDTFVLKCCVIAGVTAVFAVSVWIGLERGIRPLSNLAVALSFALLVFVLAAGPTLYILEMGTNTIGFTLQNFLRMSTWTDPGATSDFVETWTVFYWAWWLALGPFMGLFITKISGGRTIRQMVLGSLGYGTLGCSLFFIVLGNYAVHLELSGALPVLNSMNEQGAATTVVRVIDSLPLSGVVLPVFCLVCVMFAATSYDSASYTLASSATRALPRDAHPARWNRVFWAATLGALPITLIYIGGLRPLQSAVVVVSVPLLVVIGLMTVALWRDLRRHPHGE